jgi:hypothetical protein
MSGAPQIRFYSYTIWLLGLHLTYGEAARKMASGYVTSIQRLALHCSSMCTPNPRRTYMDVREGSFVQIHNP